VQTTANLIGALVNHLLAALAPKIPDEIVALYEQKCKRERKLAELSDVANMFLSVSKIFKTVYICIDALDECSDPILLLKYLNDMPTSIRIFTTGRMHTKTVVERHLGAVPDIIIDATEDDIRAFVKSKISENQSSEPDIMDEKLEEEICSNITSFSRGMSVLKHISEFWSLADP
jgi:hypothetical protein